MGDWCPKEPSCLGWDAGFFYRTKRERCGSKVKKKKKGKKLLQIFPGSGQIQEGRC